VEITDNNKKYTYYKMQLFLSILAILTTVVFSYMIFKAFGEWNNYKYLIIYAILSPILVLLFFKTKQ
jgi:hypothetical protein